MARRGDTFRLLPQPARLYIVALTLCAVAGVGAVTSLVAQPELELGVLLLTAGLCIAGNLFETFAPGHYSLQPNYAAFVWGALLLPVCWMPVLAVACFAPAWLAHRTPLYKLVFNVVDYTLCGLLVSVIGVAGGVADPDAVAVVAVAAAAVAGALVNHGLLVVVIALAGEQRLRGTLHQLTEGVPLSVGVGLLGGLLAVLWSLDPVLLVLATGPAALVYRSLFVPMLRHQAGTDPKTGLYNSERFREELAAQLEAGGRVAVAMIDLDHLRTINTRCGHLAGDRAIRGVADELAAIAASHGAAGRFGGEEFCLLLPGHDAAQARRLLDDARRKLQALEFREHPSDEELRVTFSAGVSVFPDHGDSVDALLNAADAALYDAKAAGRDRVRIALSAVAREALAVPSPAGSESVAEQPLPAASAAGGRIAGLFGRRSADRARRPGELSQVRAELDDALALVTRMSSSYLQTIVTLAGAMEDKDPYRQGSTDRVTAIAQRLARELRYADADDRAIALGAALRDIGVAAIPDAVLLKDSELDAFERAEVRGGTDLASRLVADLELPVVVKQMVRHHHEAWDGSGYPDGLAGEEIPLGARILAVADALDAMLSPRPYRPALDERDALAEIAAGTGRQFCPRVAAALSRCGGSPPWTASVAPEHPSNPGLSPLRDVSASRTIV